MIRLEFRRDPRTDLADEAIALGNAAEWELRHSFVHGDLHLVVGAESFSTDWGWVPLLDIASRLREICKSLRSGASMASYEFVAASDAMLNLTRDGEWLTLSSNYAASSAAIPLDEFENAVETATVAFIETELAANPALLANPHFRSMFPKGPGDSNTDDRTFANRN